jgi:transcriptional regulator GlxA family with amidase domain
VAVDPDPIYVRDGSCYTSAGVRAGIGLCLALVEGDFGRPLALRIAQMMVVFLRRPGGHSQFSATLEAQTRGNRPLGDLLAWPDTVQAFAGIEIRMFVKPRILNRMPTIFVVRSKRQPLQLSEP